MNKKYTNLEIKFPGELKDIVIASISDLPFLGIIENEEELIVSFNKKTINTEFLNDLQLQLNQISNEIALGEFEEIEEKNWNENWEKEVPSIIVSETLGIAPEWKIDELNTKNKVIINPKMSFGTGGHETTKLCCQVLEEIDLKNKKILDAGTGTGILSIVSIIYGAKEVIAFDNNEWSIRNAIENFKLNGVNNQIELDQFDLDEEILPKVDIVIANILSHVIERNLGSFSNAIDTNGKFIASGILIEQEDNIIEKARLVGFDLLNKKHLNEWTVLVFNKL
ncbi:50S ribosomal protein L11 methyltransferase [Candidatus Kapabacteria bacterium]|nr:50S ribosomal protein L11 methyltransferase [Candidatus Kapabacteria bacterium]